MFGATFTGHAVLIAGFAGLLAGAFSMSIGEWVVQSARGLTGTRSPSSARNCKDAPQEEQEELALIYQLKGLTRKQPRDLAASLMQQSGTAWNTLAREELGIDPKDLAGPPGEQPSPRFSCSPSGRFSRCFRHLHSWASLLSSSA